MAGERTSFPHLRLVAHDSGTAKLSGGGKVAARTAANKNGVPLLRANLGFEIVASPELASSVSNLGNVGRERVKHG